MRQGDVEHVAHQARPTVRVRRRDRDTWMRKGTAALVLVTPVTSTVVDGAAHLDGLVLRSMCTIKRDW